VNHKDDRDVGTATLGTVSDFSVSQNHASIQNSLLMENESATMGGSPPLSQQNQMVSIPEAEASLEEENKNKTKKLKRRSTKGQTALF